MATPFPFPSPMFARNGSAPLLAAASPAPANPWINFFANAATDLGYGLTHAPDLSGALGAATQQTAQLQPYREQADYTKAEKAKADATLAANQNQTQKWLAQNRPDLSGLPVDQAWQIAMQGGSKAADTPEERAKYAQQFGLTGDEAKVYTLTGKLPGRDNGETWFGNVLQYQDPQTKEIINYQISNQGNIKRVDAGGGAMPAVPVTYQNTGTAMTPVTKFGGAPTSATPIPIDNSGKTFGEGLGTAGATTFGQLQKDAVGAYGTMGTLNQMQSSLDNPNFYSGFGGDQVLAIKQLAAALGADPNAAASMESFNAASKKVILDGLGGSLGTAISNSDRDFIAATAPNLGNTKAGNQQLIDIGRKLAQRKIDIAQVAAQYVQQHGSLDANWPLALKQYAEANPMFTTAASPVGAGPAPGGTQTLVYNPNTGELE